MVAAQNLESFQSLEPETFEDGVKSSLPRATKPAKATYKGTARHGLSEGEAN